MMQDDAGSTSKTQLINLLLMPEFKADLSIVSYESRSSSIGTMCPGKAAARRLRQFEQCWTRESTRSVCLANSDSILHLSEQDVMVTRLLGTGGFSMVNRVYLRNPITGQFDSEQSFAMKKLKPPGSRNFSATTTAASDFGLETKILNSLRHENVIKLHAVKAGDMIQSLKQGTHFIILEELVETLDVKLQQWRSKQTIFHPKSKSSICRRLHDVALGIANGMAYLHSKKIIFR